MRLRVHLAAAAFLLFAAFSCSPEAPEPSSDGTWVGTITTEGNVTTVINESGSVWGGTATLVEVASIGVESGADEYMFGEVYGVWATGERILAVDAQIPTVRVYDMEGEHVIDVGRHGEGPGEFTDPIGVAVTRDGDILVLESSVELQVFDTGGVPKATWNTGSPMRVFGDNMLTLGSDDVPWVASIDLETRKLGRVRLGPDGVIGEPTYPPESNRETSCLTYRRGERERTYCNIPFHPFWLSTLTPDGAWAAGFTDAYRFEILAPDGSTLAVERYWTPVPVSSEEASYRKEQATRLMRDQVARDPTWTWSGPDVAAHKPAYLRLFADRNGRIWVLREKVSRQSTDCPGDSEMCWLPEGYWLDAFAPDGRFLGSASLDDLPFSPFINGETIVAVVVDAAGTIMVKRYRLVPPGEAED